jgi:hypothetical protein
MLQQFRVIILRLWQQFLLMQRCQALRARGFRVRRRGQFLLIACRGGGKRPCPQIQTSRTRKSRAEKRGVLPPTRPVAAFGSPRNTRPYR